MLGSLQVRGERDEIAIPAARQRVLLAALLLRANELVPVDDLVVRIWDDRPPREARAAVQTYVHRLRRLLGHDMIASQPGGYLIAADSSQLDLIRFDELVEQADRADDPGVEARLLAEALALWRGPPLSNVASEILHRDDVPVLVERRLQVMQRRIDLELAEGRHGDLVAELRSITAEHPLRERFWAQLMRALAGAGRPAEALSAYEQLRQRLAGELGIDPSPEVQQAHLAILRGEVASRSVAVAKAAPAQLPPAVSGFTGRSQELSELDGLLRGEDGQVPPALVISAIEGAAGVGKTALAVYWAHRVADRFTDGQLYVNLRGFDPSGSPMDPAEAVRIFLEAWDVPVSRIPASFEAQVGLYRSLLSGRRVLIVLDNARDVEQVRPLLPGSPGCLVVVTSRHHLSGLVAEGARLLTVDTLSTAEAYDLLVRRLGSRRVSAEPQAANEIVHRCARLPLALAIVAARAVSRPHFRLAELAAELRDVGDRWNVLTGTDPTTDARAVFSWSYRTLTTDAARLFRLLGLHHGPDLSSQAAASLIGVPPQRVRPLLAELTHAHMLVEHVPGRYTFHDLLRAYAADLATASDSDSQRRAAIRRVLDHYLHTAEQAARLLDPVRDPIGLSAPADGTVVERFADDHQAMAWFNAEHRVLLATIERASQSGWHTHAWQLGLTLVDFLDRRGHWHDYTASQRIALAAAQRTGEPQAQAHAHRHLARACTRRSDFDAAHRHLRSALDLYRRSGDQVGQAHSYIYLAYVERRQDHLHTALDHAGRALDMYRAAGYRAGQAIALNQIGWYHSLLNDHQQALRCCHAALYLFQELADRNGQAAAWDSLGHAHHHLGQHTAALTCYGEALALLRVLGNRYSEADVLHHVGDTHHAAGNHAAAFQAWRQALTILTELDHPDALHIRAKLHQSNGAYPR